MLTFIAGERLPCGAAYLIDQKTGKARLVRDGEREMAFALRDIAAGEMFTVPATYTGSPIAASGIFGTANNFRL